MFGWLTRQLHPRRSLRTAIVLALTLSGLITSAAGSYLLQKLHRRHLEGQLIDRSRMVAESVARAAETVDELTELQRFVTVTAAEKDVTMVIVAGGEPLQVLASSRLEWNGRPVSSLPEQGHVGRDLEATLIRNRPRHEFVHAPKGNLDYSTPVRSYGWISEGSHAAPGAVLVHVDTSSVRRGLQTTAMLQIATLLTCVVSIGVVSFVLVDRRVIKPIIQAQRVLKQRADGDESVFAEVHCEDEIGTLSQTLNEMLATMAERERQQIELHNALQESVVRTEEARIEMEFRQFAINQAAILSETLPDGTFSYANDALCGLTGYARDELLAMKRDTLIEGCNTSRIIQEINETTARGDVWRGELMGRTKDGRTYWADTTIVPTLDHQQAVTQCTMIQFDITERKTAQERLHLVVEAARVGIWDWDMASAMFYTNEQYNAMLGYDHAERHHPISWFFEMLHPDDRENTERDLEAALENASACYDLEFRLRTSQGNYRWIRSSGKVVERDANGRALRMTGQHIDIDARKTIEEKLRESKNISELANRAKSEFLANMSHEIRTPLTAILGYAELLQDDQELIQNPSRRQDTVRTIQRNGEHLLAIINDILDLSKIEARKMTIELLPTSVIQAISEVLSLMQVRAIAKNIQLKAEIIGEIPAQIQTDPVRLRQILVNLVGNAIKFTDLGYVAIRARFDTTDPNVPRLEISVEDSGIGMSPEQQQKLFKSFTQADASTTRRFGGTGLGLLISKRLAEMLGGDIVVDSELGAGSTFRVTIATGETAAARVTQSDLLEQKLPPGSNALATVVNSEQTKPLQDVAILVAEDGPDNQRLISFVLRKAGAKVTVVENGLEAVKCLTEGGDPDADLIHPPPFDVLLLDMQMPVMDGYTAASLLRNKGNSTPVIALTAHAMEGERHKCLQAGCDDYATKPLNRAALIQQIASHCRNQASKNRPSEAIAAK